MSGREKFFSVSTPFDGAKTVVCYTNTWHDKIIPAKRVPNESPELVMSTLKDPTFVVSGTTNPGYLVFINQSVVSPRTGSPFVAIVDPDGQPEPVLASVGHRKEFIDLSKHSILWARVRSIK